MRRSVVALSFLFLVALSPGSPAGAASGGASAGPTVERGERAPTVEADFNDDGFEDLAVGVIYEDVGSAVDAGGVNVIYGSSSGLTATGNQLWTQDSPGIADQAEGQDRFGRALAAGDFNGDGHADLAIGAPYEDIGSIGGAGAVNVLYGSDTGLSDAGNQFWHQDSPGVKDVAETADRLGRAVGAGDFNGDGFDDLAIGVSFEDSVSIKDAGAINVLYGSATGLVAAGNNFLHQDSPGIQGQSGQGERFGWVFAAEDFNGDGFEDVAVGDPGDTVNGVPGAGGVNVIYGSASGLTPAGNQWWNQAVPGVLDAPERDDLFGRSLRSDDFNGDGFADLLVGIPSEVLGPIDDAGAVAAIYGSATGLVAAGNQFWTQDSPGILDQSEPRDHMGRHIGAGDFNGDGFGDIVVGVVSEDIGPIEDAGAANVIYGSASGLTSAGNQVWSQDSPDVEGTAEANDQLGRANSGFDFNGDGFDDLAIGASGDNVAGVLAAGAVNVLHGTPGGVSEVDDQLWTQESPGILGDAQTGDAFGSCFPGGPAGSGAPIE
jgi:disulfide bond formation protein DsbB